ncbi:hypothetical protein EX30DRAFT_375976 [Ascodesmis nigricans]|uniref:Uncharacterized protein n=1 Tax=Ascodesmis nigricans TaxID=341454 RepID=A0A4S2N5G4_9PEZI|nr:hypothetical protein EX30DRAFT_375976 [Ascodesmis nigricans]
MKKFVPPLLKNRPPPSDTDGTPPPAKKQRVNSTGSTGSNSSGRSTPGSGFKTPFAAPTPLNRTNSGSNFKSPFTSTASKFRKPLLSLANPKSTTSVSKSTEPTGSVPTTQPVGSGSVSYEGYYNILWRKKTTKKHKTFDGDGVLVISNGYATLKDQSGKDLGKTMMNKALEPGDTISVGGKDVEIDSLLSKNDYLAGRPFLKAVNAKDVTKSAASQNSLAFKGLAKGFKTPLLNNTVMEKTDKKVPTPRHDPNAEGSLVMKRWYGKVPSGKTVVDVVVDPYLSQHLRPHQREGVDFMYQCVMGMKNFEGKGAILADEMGLGKTLQTIALLWTLLKQNPIYEDPPVVKKAMIVCPVTLINNWRKEFKKWLGNERIGVFVADSKANLRDFIAGRTYSVMIIGYEKLQRVHAELKKANIDIVIADEGHRLKTEKNKSAQAIRSLDTPRRIILSGTPLQNDLHEFFIMVDFVNPGLLETYATFRKEFENPILKSRQPNATSKSIELGSARSEELARITSMFVLRRTAEILSKFLPPKSEYVVFCRPTSRQLAVYRNILDSRMFEECLGSPSSSLCLITMLKKLCNSPGLLSKDDSEIAPVEGLLQAVDPKYLTSKAPSTSGKLRVLSRIVQALKANTDEKIVIVSNYTSTLDMIQTMLSSHGLTFLRLDGKTPTDKRQELVDRFNRTDSNFSFAFLLSAKSGGAGLNLIGASRLLLFDLDWNPATDAQAMARIHRDGQKRPVFIYRMLTTGCFDEKIFQRQITKQGLADEIMDSKKGAAAFTLSELRDLFTLIEDTKCGTHDLMGCSCGGKGYVKDEELEGVTEKEWNINDSDSDDAEDFTSLFVKASQISEAMIKAKRPAEKKREKEALGALILYEHIDTDLLAGGGGRGVDEEGDEYPDVSVEDDVLMNVLCEEGKQREVSYVFQRSY